MKYKSIIIATLVFTSACATWFPSPEKMQEAKTCKVWKKRALDLIFADVNAGEAQYEVSCRLMNMALCTYGTTHFEGDDIHFAQKGASVFKSKSMVGTLKDSVLKITSTGITAEPVTLGKGKANVSFTALGVSRQEEIFYNQACDKRQAALGVALLVGH